MHAYIKVYASMRSFEIVHLLLLVIIVYSSFSLLCIYLLRSNYKSFCLFSFAMYLFYSKFYDILAFLDI
jgi:hypothetical protein